MTRPAQCSLALLLLAAPLAVVGCSASNNSGTTGGASGGATRGTTVGTTGGTTGAATGGTTGGTTGVATVGTTGAVTGGTTGAATGGTTRATTGGTTGAATGGTTGAATGGTTGAATGGTTAGTTGGRGGSSAVNPGIDWSVKVTDSTLKNPSALSGWGYWNGFTLSAIYRVYQRTQTASYLQSIKSWADAVVDATGNVKTTITSLDLVQPGLVLMLLYENTQTAKYQVGPKAIRQYLTTYKRTADGGFWHMTQGTGASSTLGVDQLWADGTYMSTPFLMKYGTLFNDLAASSDEVAKQLTVYASHLQDSATGLFFHAYDEKGTATWADPTTHHSSEFWGRSIGWFGMALVDDLDTIPADHPQRAAVLKILTDLIAGLAQFQSPSGLWYQVVNKGDQAGNWLETSCSSMYTYVISKAVEKGYVDSGTYLDVANKGYKGVLTKISLGTDGVTTTLSDICVGTDVGNYAYYIARDKKPNDLHGLGAFLIMNEQMIKTASTH